MATMRSLGFSIFSRYDGSGVAAARRDIDGFNGSVNRSTSAMNSWNGRIILATKAIAVFGPALLPIAASLTSIAGAATAMGTSVGAALSTYGLAVKNAIDTTNAMAKAGKALSAAQKDFIKSQDAFNKAVSTFGQGFRDETLKAVSATLRGLTNALKGLEPVAKAIAPEVTKVAQAFEKWTKGDSFKNYVNLIKASAVPAFRDLVAAAKDFLNVVGDGFRAFLPHGTTLAKTLREGAAALKQWSDGGGFQRFLAYVRENSPAVKEFFTALKDALSNVLAAMRELGPFSLLLATGLLKLVAAIPPEWLAAMVKGFVVWKAAMLAWAVASGIAAAAQLALTIAASPFFMLMAGGALTIGLVIAAVAALAVGLYFLVTRWETVKAALVTAWNATWNAMKVAAETVWNALKTAWQAVTGWFSTVWTTVSATLSAAWGTVWNALKTAAETVWNALKTAWNAVVSAFMTVWQPVGAALSAAWNAFWGLIKSVASDIWNALKAAWEAFVGALKSIWDVVGGPLKAAWDLVWNGMKTAAETIWTALKAAWELFINGLQTIWNAVSTVLRAAWDVFWNGLKTGVETIWNALKAAWELFINSLQTVWTTVSTVLRAAWDVFWNGLKTAVETIWNALKAAWEAFWAFVQQIFTNAAAIIKGAWELFWTGIKTFVETIWNGIKLAWETFLNAVKTTWDTVSAALKTAWETVWNAIKQFAEELWNTLKTAWETFLNAIKTAWDTASELLKTAWQTVWNFIKETADTIWNEVKGLWDTFLKAIQTAWDTASDLIKKAWEDTWNAVKDIAQKVWQVIGGTIEKAINGVIGLINKLISGFNKITSFLEINVQISEIPEVQFPGLAKGGMVEFAHGGMTRAKDLRGGGALSGYAPGRDTIPAILSRGEGVLTPEAVRGLGGAGFVNSANRTFAGHRGAGAGAQAFSRGGIPAGVRAKRCSGHGEGYAHGGMVNGMVPFAVGGLTAAALARAGISTSMVIQGEHSDGALSAGTHLGGGAVDLPADPALLSRLHAAGFAAWMRGPANGMSPHIHAVLMNHPDLSPAARAQVASFRAGGSGLGVGGGGGGGIDVMGMIRPHIGKILLNVYRGLAPLLGIAGGVLAKAFGGFDQTIDADPVPAEDVARRQDLMRRAEAGDRAAISELAKGASEGALDRDSIIIQPAPFTGRPSSLTHAAGNSASNRAGFDQSKDWLLPMLAKFVLPALSKEHIAEGLSDAKKGIDAFGGGGGFSKIAAGFGSKLIDDVIPDFLMKKAAAAPPPPVIGGGGEGYTGNVQQWSGLAAQALARAGISADQLPRFLALMQAESGGNPGVQNNWDSNAAKGQASRGLMQVIPSTFAAYRDPSLSSNIFDPLANMTAAARYIKARYGGQVPGSPYALGTPGATAGPHLVGELGPELVNFRGGETVTPANETADILSGANVPAVTTPTPEGGGLPQETAIESPLMEQMTQFQGPPQVEGWFGEVIGSAQHMLTTVQTAWDGTVAAGTAAQPSITSTTTAVGNEVGVNIPTQLEAMASAATTAWADMSATSLANWQAQLATVYTPSETHMGTTMPAMSVTMQVAHDLAWTTMNATSTAQWGIMRDTTYLEAETHQGTTMPAMSVAMQTAHDLAWTTMNATSTAQWTIMRDTTYAEAELHMGTTMPTMSVTMQTAHDLAWTTMNATSTAQWTAIRDNNILPFEEHMQTTMPAAAQAMNEAVSAAFTAMVETIVAQLDTAIAKIEEFIAATEAAIAAAEALAAAQAAAAASGGSGAGGTLGGASGSAEAALAAAGISSGMIVQGPYSNSVSASAGTHSGGGVYDIAGGPELLPALHAAGFAAWYRSGPGWEGNEHIHAVYSGATDLSPQAAWQLQDFQNGGSGLGIPGNLAVGSNNAARGWTWVGEKGPELMRMHGGEQVMPHEESLRFAARMRKWAAPGYGRREGRQFTDSIVGADIRGTYNGGNGGISIKFEFNGPVSNGDDVRKAIDEAIPKLRTAIQAGSGRRRIG